VLDNLAPQVHGLCCQKPFPILALKSSWFAAMFATGRWCARRCAASMRLPLRGMVGVAQSMYEVLNTLGHNQGTANLLQAVDRKAGRSV